MMSAEWQRVDDYICERLLVPDPALAATLEANAAAGLPAIDVSPAQGKLLCLLARAIGARRILEIGTLGGYSTIWLARALPADGRLVTLEADARHAEVARANLARAGLADRVEVRVGRALELLPALAADGGAPFDLVFIDADKESNAQYVRWAARLGRPGGLIIVDNVVREGDIADPASRNRSVAGTRRMFDELAEARGLTATAIQTVGAKGWDGFAMILLEDGLK